MSFVKRDESIKKHHKVVIVGGGIVGASILRTLALHGIDCLLINKGDFSSQTSSRSSKMLHGGIRYLESFDFSLVHEALREKNLWLDLAPHLAYEAKFHLPVYRDFKYPLLGYRAALAIYDTLSLFKNSPHKILNAPAALQEIPELRQEGLTGAGIYYDAIVDDSKLCLENIYDACLEPNAKALSYCELVKCTEDRGRYVLEIKDQLQGDQFSVSAEHLIFATGPFSDRLLKKLDIRPNSAFILPSKGIHLWLKKESLDIKNPLVLQTKDGRVVFIMPQQEAILVGTTETLLSEHDEIYDIEVTQEDIEYLLLQLKEFFPQTKISEENIITSYAGVRPLVRSHKNMNKTSRKERLVELGNKMHLLIGGKLTTFRTMVFPLVKKILKEESSEFDPHLTANPFRQQSLVLPFKAANIDRDLLYAIITQEKVRTLEDLKERRLGSICPHRFNFSEDLSAVFNDILKEAQLLYKES